MNSPGVRVRRAQGACWTARRRERGVTLIELIVSMVLLGMLALTATLMWVDGFSLVRTVNADSGAIAEARAVLERLSREIREVKFNATSNAYCVSTMTATQMVFNKTVGNYVPACGGATPTAANDDFAVSVARSGTNLNLGYAGTLATPAMTSALTGDASSFAIRYLDATYTATTDPAALRFVELSLTLAPANGPATQSRTVVALRNE